MGKSPAIAVARADPADDERLRYPPEAVARATAFAIEQPDDVEIGDITIRPTVQG
jgi:NADP-dependent 3-hydroxy acid dehydrogenase YdfG